MPTAQRIVIGITGASGAAYARRVVSLLVGAGIHTHVVISPAGQRLLHDELGIERVTPQTFLDDLPHSATHAPAPPDTDKLIMHPHRDVGAAIASGSFQHNGMAIVPCSSNTLSAVAHGSAGNLLHRAAAVTLKERRPLVLAHREMPIGLVDIRNMQLAAEAGATICPTNPGFYMLPKTIDDLIDFVAARILDALNIQHHLPVRWGQPTP